MFKTFLFLFLLLCALLAGAIGNASAAAMRGNTRAQASTE
jgi:hypothetical protein